MDAGILEWPRQWKMMVYWNFMVFNGDLMGFSSDLIDYEWDIPPGND